jgi:hypothetical protein
MLGSKTLAWQLFRLPSDPSKIPSCEHAMPLARGDVVALRRCGVGIIWRADGDDLWVVPVWGKNGPPRHRAEVEIEDVGEIAACGISLRYPVARCQSVFKVSVARLASAARLGAAPAALLSRLIAAVVREAQAQQTEDRMHYLRPMYTERAVQMV